MPTEEKIVKKISIGDDSRYIAAKYDLDGEEITTTYAKANIVVTKQNIIDGKITVQDEDETEIEYDIIDPDTWAGKVYVDENFIKTSEAQDYIKDEISSLIGKGEIKVEAPQTKKFEYVGGTDGITTLQLESEDDYGQILKIIIYNGGSSSESDTGNVILNGSTNSMKSLPASYLKKGSTFEIYNNVLLCTSHQGDREVIPASDVTQGEGWSNLEINSNQPFWAIVYKEGWKMASEEGEE